jgi:hypothetical protein
MTLIAYFSNSCLSLLIACKTDTANVYRFIAHIYVYLRRIVAHNILAYYLDIVPLLNRARLRSVC